MQLPSNLDDHAMAQLLWMAARFVILSDQLWRRQSQGRHQLYIPSPPQRMSLIQDAHDKLGHKGFYSTCCTLLDRF